MLQPRSTSSLKIQLLLAMGLLAVMVVVLILCYRAPRAKPPSPLVTVFSPPRTIRPFQLSHFSEKDFQHHWTFLFFGFSHCATICPTTLTELNDVYRQLHPRYPELQIVFVSIDPEQEHHAASAHYAASFNNHFIGQSGTLKQVEQLKQQFGVVAERNPSSDSATINHTRAIFLINPAGQWTALFPGGMRAQIMSSEFARIYAT